MTPREKFRKALRCEPVEGHVPHFELSVFLTMEAIGRVHPCHRQYSQWYQMSRREQRLQMLDMAQAHIEIADKYHHSAIFVHPNPGPQGEMPTDIHAAHELLETIRELSGDKYFLMLHGDPTCPIPTGETMMDFSAMMYEEPKKIHEQTKRRLEWAEHLCDEMSKYPGLLDGWILCSDYCFNANPFFSPDLFTEFIQPYLKEILDYYRAAGYYSIKHTDGNIMPILKQIVECGPDAIHSLDPQGGVSLKEVKQLYGDRVCLVGNVNCGLLQTGTEEEIAADVRRSLREGMPGYGYIFSTSNCVYTGLELKRYELMNKIWWEEGIYPSGGASSQGDHQIGRI